MLVLGATSMFSGGCGREAKRTALAVREARTDSGAVVVTTECADQITFELHPDPLGSGLTQVSLWGYPTVGRCRPEIHLNGVDASTTKLVDAATGQVVSVDQP